MASGDVGGEHLAGAEGGEQFLGDHPTPHLGAVPRRLQRQVPERGLEVLRSRGFQDV